MNIRIILIGLVDAIMFANIVTRFYDLMYGKPDWVVLSFLTIYFIMRLKDLHKFLQTPKEIKE